MADAYRGADIQRAVRDLLAAPAGRQEAILRVGDERLGLHGRADLLVYVGHNGLMDFELPPTPRADARTDRAAMILACRSKPYFLPRLDRLGCRPVLLTTGLMAPEAYTLEAAVGAWIAGDDAASIREQAAQAYHHYQKCGMNGARRLFCAADPSPPVSSL